MCLIEPLLGELTASSEWLAKKKLLVFETALCIWSNTICGEDSFIFIFETKRRRTNTLCQTFSVNLYWKAYELNGMAC